MNRNTPTAHEAQRRFIGGAAKPTVDIEARTCELSFSSTAPVERAFGTEVLSHAPDAADLSRLNSSAPLLFNHDANDVLGVVQSASVSGGKGRAVVRFGRDARGEWAMRQAADGVLVNVSFAYRVTQYQDAANGDLVATRWEALEISLVTVPADKSVGIGRSINTFRKPNIMDDDLDTQQRPTRAQRALENQESLRRQAQDATALERMRSLEIAALGRRYDIPETMVRAMQQDGTSVDDARARVAEIVLRKNQNSRPISDVSSNSAEIGLSDSETRDFSICRAMSAMINNDWSRAGLEREASRAVGLKLGRQTQGVFVPLEVMQRTQWQTRAPYAVGAAGTGGNVVSTDLKIDYFTEALRNQSQVIAAGATVLSGLVGNVDIPTRATVTPTYWVAESGAITEGEATFGKISLRPKTLGALSKMSRLMLQQSTPAIEMLARADMMLQMGLGIDLAALSGSGSSNQPLGIFGTAGIGSVIGGTNGANLTLDTLIALETQLANSNAPVGARGYLLNTKSIATLKNLKSSTGQYLWTTDSPGQRSGTPPSFGGYTVFPTNQLRSTLTKGSSSGVCSELVFGAWDELIIGEWGVLEVVANPYDSAGFTSGDVLVRAMQTVDIAVRHPASFAVMSDALTP